MMNVIAMWMLLSSVGGAMVMSPESLIVKTPDSEEHPMSLAKDATKESLHFASEAARHTGEGIRRSVTSASQIPAKAAHTVQRKAEEAAQAIKDGSQAGLEKIGLAQPAKHPSHFDLWESGLQASKEKAAALKDATAGSVVDAQQGVQDTFGAYFGKEKPPTPSEVVKQKWVHAHDATKDATVETAEAAKNKAWQEVKAAKDTVKGTGEWIHDGAYAAKNKAGQEVKAMKDTVKGTEEWVHDGAHAAKNKAGQEVKAVKDTVKGTEEWIHDGAHAAKNKAGQEVKAVKDTVKGTGEWIHHGAHDAYQSTEDTASAVKGKASNAAGFGKEKISESVENLDDLASKIAQSVEDNINAAGGKASETAEAAYDHAADGLKETATRTKRVVGMEENPPSYQDRIQQATEQAADLLRSRGKEAASYLPNVGQGLAYAGPDSVGDYASKAGELIDVKGKKEPETDFKSRFGGYVEGVKRKLKGAPPTVQTPTVQTPTVQTDDWREEFLNKLGIYSEKDLSKKDVVVGNLKGYFTGGLFHRAGEALSSAATATEDAAYSAGEKASESLSKAGEAAEHTKDVAVDEVKHAGEIDTIPESHDPHENLTQSSADENHLRNRAADLYKKFSWVTTAWLVSSCRAAHLFAFSSVYGTSLWVTFVSGYVLSRSVSRHQFGYVQSRVFPTYLKLIASGQAVCLLLYMVLHPWGTADGAEKLQYLDLWGILLSTVANTFFLEPQATKVMFEKLKLEKDEGRGQEGFTGAESEETKARLVKINNAFHVFHGYSSIANLVSLLGMTWHLWHLSRRLVI